jgi:aminopeptidase YwaD
MVTRSFTLIIFTAFIGSGQVALAQKKADKKMIAQLQANISYLASDSLEGRRTGTDGERKAAAFIRKNYAEAGIPPYKGEYLHPFHFAYGKEIASSTHIKVNSVLLLMNDEAFPLPFSANRKAVSDIIPDIQEQGGIWLIPAYTDRDQADDPHFDAEKFFFDKSKEAQQQGASGVVFFDAFGSKYEPVFSRHSEYDAVGIPVVFINSKGYKKTIGIPGAKKDIITVDLNVTINKAERNSNNIAAYIDNHAKYTVILGAHYDHLGYGEDGNSLFANAKKEHLIHHGADDNASGTAAVLELAKWVKKKKLHHYNYLFINFSGEELGLYGSKAFVKDEAIDSAHIACMINLDMVGRLNDSTHSLTLGGVGTSPVWAGALEMGGDYFKLTIDSSGVGPSDHTSFYNAGIPVLFFFTGSHKDYHKPSDKADLINYPGEVKVIKYVSKVVAKIDKEQVKPAFTATKQTSSGYARFRVTLGIMPDYTFETGGVRVDGVSDNRPAMKAGIKQGDILTRLGTIKINGMQSYMEALSKFAPGDKTRVTFIRDGKEMESPIELAK